MWLRRAVVDLPLNHLFTQSNKLLNPSTYKLTTICYNCRNLSRTSTYLQNKAKYVYDPSTDSFLPKGQIPNAGYEHEHGKHVPENSFKQTFRAFLKRFSRSLFLITGALVWGGIIFVTLFVDFQDPSEDTLQLQDSEEEVRLFAFYDTVQNQTDLANLLSRGKEFDIDEIDAGTRMKEAALHNALNRIKKHNVIVETLGKPVQLLGYRAAEKLDQMVKQFQYLKQYGMEKFKYDVPAKDTWTAECVLEGPEGLVSLFLEFEKPSEKQEWILSKVVVKSLEKSGNHLLDLSGSMPEGVKLSD